MSIGDLSLESTLTLFVTWCIPDFFRLGKRRAYSLQSPDFPFADGRYCLRLFATRDSDSIEIELLSLTDPDPGRALLYEVRFKSGTGEEDMHRQVRGNRVELYFDRDELEDERDRYVPDGSLTLLCAVRPREQSVGGTPNSGGDRTRVIPPRRKTFGELSSESSPSLYVTWTILRFFRLVRKSEYILESPEFHLSGRRHRLRLRPVKNYAAFCLGGIVSVNIDLVNLSDSDPERYISYDLGFKSTAGEEIHIDRWNESKSFYIFPNDLDRLKSKCFTDSHLTLFCCVGSREPSSAESQTSCGAETPRSKDPVPQAAGQTKSVGVQTSDEEGHEEGLPETTNSVSCAIQTEISESVSSSIQTEVLENMSCAIQTEVPESASCAIQTEVPDEQKHFQDEEVSSLDTKGVAKSQYDYYKYFLQAA